MNDQMYVIKRDGRHEDVLFDKITSRMINLINDKRISYTISSSVQPSLIVQKIAQNIYPGIKTVELDELTASMAAKMATTHPDYLHLASRLVVSNMHKETMTTFTESMLHMYNNTDIISKELYNVIIEHGFKIDNYIDYVRDFNLDYFGIKTLERNYLLKLNGKVIERPQTLFMRVAIGIHGNNLEKVFETYDLMSQKFFIHATPTLFHAGTRHNQFASCFLMGMEDSVEGIYKCITDMALISKWAGGIGVHISDIRGKNSLIRGTNGKSNGIMPMMKVINDTARFINQSGKRNGSIAIYLEPWHSDIVNFLEAKKNTGVEEERARDLFYAIWMNDLFMERVLEDKEWTLFNPDIARDLNKIYGYEFKKLYEEYERDDIGTEKIKARDLWKLIITSQIETGTPYIVYKDAANRKSNQQNLGTIRSSNLCAEIIEYSDENEYAVCNLASISLSSFVKDKVFDFEKLHYTAGVITNNLNIIIDKNFYPTPETKVSNLRHRPIGIGVQGLADCYCMMGFAFDSEEARQLNREIFETIYHGALTRSMILAREYGTYDSYNNSPLSKGLFQFDLWENERLMKIDELNDKIKTCENKMFISKYKEWVDNLEYNWLIKHSGRYDWDKLRRDIMVDGVRNSLLIAPMPTASTSQILGNNECFEPYTYNLYVRRTLAGEFTVINRHLINDLIDLGIWNEELKDKLVYYDGKINKIPEIPEKLKDIYKCAYEINQKAIINQSADRGLYVCQSQSMNLFVDIPKFNEISALHFYGWKRGLKTGCYYLRTNPASNAQKFSLDPELEEKLKNSKTPEKKKANFVCTDEVCTMCSA